MGIPLYDTLENSCYQREMDFSWTEKELSCRELLKSHVDFQTKEVLEKKPKQKYKDRKYHQQERFDPVYIKEIRQKVIFRFCETLEATLGKIKELNRYVKMYYALNEDTFVENKILNSLW